jgi:hypothetical protein
VCRDESGRRVYKVGLTDVLRLSAEVVNEGEDAHETTLTVQLPANVNYIGTTDELKVCGGREGMVGEMKE